MISSSVMRSTVITPAAATSSESCTCQMPPEPGVAVAGKFRRAGRRGTGPHRPGRGSCPGGRRKPHRGRSAPAVWRGFRCGQPVECHIHGRVYRRLADELICLPRKEESSSCGRAHAGLRAGRERMAHALRRAGRASKASWYGTQQAEVTE